MKIKGDTDKAMVAGYINEIHLLQQLCECERIIKLYDSEVNHAEGYLSMVRNHFVMIV